jgi:hypothetical protein
VKSNKNDYIDAEASCEAASRPAMRFVEPRTEAPQLLAALHRVREGLVVASTATINRIHKILLEFGIVVLLSRTSLRALPDALAMHDLPLRLVQLIDRLDPVHWSPLGEMPCLPKPPGGLSALFMDVWTAPRSRRRNRLCRGRAALRRRLG